MPITGAQLTAVLKSVGAGTGMIAGADQLAAGANRSMDEAGIKTVAGRAAYLATMAQESAYFRTTTEYGSGQSYAPYIGRTFQQVTWRDNYAAFGQWLRGKGRITDPNYFVYNPSKLSDFAYAWDGGTWFWTARRSWGSYSNLAQLADGTGSILMVSRAVNAGNPYWSGTPNGMATRQTMFDKFKALGSALLPGTTTTPPATTVPHGWIPGTGAMVVTAAIAGWNQYKNRFYGNAWPPLRSELGVPNQPWCGHAVRWMIRKGTGHDIVKWCPGYAWTPTFAKKCNTDPLWKEVAYKDAKPGDVVFFFRSAADARNLYCYHVGMVEAGPTAAGHDLRTLEGNTSTPGISSSMSMGGTYAKKVRDDRLTSYYRMRIWRPPYYQNVTTNPDGPVTDTDTPIGEEVVTVIEEAPRPPQPTVWDDWMIGQDPIEELRMSASYLAAAREGGRQVTRVDAWYDGREHATDLPLVASESEITDSDDSPVRRTADLKFQANSTAELRDLYDLLATPGIQLRVSTGYQYGGAVELAPVHTGICDTPKLDWPSGRISVSSPDLMALVAKDSFGNPVNNSPDMTFAQTIAFFTCESVARSRMAVLTQNADLMPAVVYDSGPASRVEAVMEAAMAIGCELYASPVPERFVLRPWAQLTDAPRWTVALGDNLISSATSTDWSTVGNLWIVRSERSDGPLIQGEYRATDEDDPLRWGGPFGRRTKYFNTSLYGDREQCETAARALYMRGAGGRVNFEWSMLRNPLMQSGDRVTVYGPHDTTYDLILSSFKIPLGSQNVTPGTARSLGWEGVS